MRLEIDGKTPIAAAATARAPAEDEISAAEEPKRRDVGSAWESLLQQTPAADAGAGAGGGAAEGAGGGAGGAGAQAQAALKNNGRLMNIVFFFVVYAAFKYLVDKDG